MKNIMLNEDIKWESTSRFYGFRNKLRRERLTKFKSLNVNFLFFKHDMNLTRGTLGKIGDDMYWIRMIIIEEIRITR